MTVWTVGRFLPLASAIFILTLISAAEGLSSQPNIIMVLLDDAGRADFEYFDSAMHTPNIEAIRKEGMYLNSSYSLPMCAPTRAAILTGRYPHTYGVQEGNAISGNHLQWVNENFTMVGDELKKLGYRTHMLGKWHQGFCHPSLTPLGRGFDTFYGFWFGSHSDYYTHFKGTAFDFWDQDRVARETEGIYQTDLLNDRAEKIVQESDPDVPLYMYLSYGAPHGPFQVPDKYISGTKCKDVGDSERQIHCAMVASVDEGVGRLAQALKDKGTYDNTVIVIMSDNGGPVWYSGSRNYPLRGAKQTLYEGGTRVFTVFKAPGLKETNVDYQGMVHSIDWLPTFVDIAGGPELPQKHGRSVWNALKENSASPRTDFIYQVNDFLNHSAYRVNNWKLIVGKGGPLKKSGWFDTPETIWGLNGTSINKDYEIYDVDQDPYEKYELMKSLKVLTKIAELEKMLEEKLEAVDSKESSQSVRDKQKERLRFNMQHRIDEMIAKHQLKTIYSKEQILSVKEMLFQYRDQMVEGENPEFPLQPYNWDPPKYPGGIVDDDGNVKTCWCHPSNVPADDKSCPK